MAKTQELLGREREREVLRGLVADAADAREGRSLLVRGEAGIGKTALLDDTAARAVRRHPKATVLRCAGVGSEADGSPAFGGLLELLTPVLDRTETLPPFQRAALEAALGLRSVHDETGNFGELTVRTALRTLLETLATDTPPLLLVVDDLPSLDAATRAALLYVARRPLPGSAVLLAARPAPHTDATLRDLPVLDVSGLDATAARALLAARGVRGVDTAALLDDAEGNPLALLELPAPDGTSPGPLPLDTRLRAAFTHRTRALPPEARTLLLTAAVETRGSTDAVLAAARHQGVPDAALAITEEAGLLDVTGPTLRFRHPLLRSSVHADAPSRDRGRAHLALAATLTGHDALWHRALAGDRPDAELASALESAADEINGRGGLAATATVLTRAADLSTDPEATTRRLAAAAHAAWKSGHPEAARRLVSRATEQHHDAGALELARLRGLIAYSGGDQPDALRQLARAADEHAPCAPTAAAALLFMSCDTAEHAGLDDEVRRAALRITELQLPPRYREYGRLLAEAPEGAVHDPWAVLSAAPDDLGTSRVHRWLWPLAITRDGAEPLTAREFAATACAEIAAAGVAALLPRPLLWLADLECRTGRLAEAAAHAKEALRLTRDLDHPVSRADALALLARLAALHGDTAACRTYADEAAAAALPLRNRAAAAEAAWALALLALAHGDPAGAADRLLPVHTPGSPRAHRRIARLSAAELTQALAGAGDPEAAKTVAKQAAARAESAGLPWATAQAALCRLFLTTEETGEESGEELWAAADHGYAEQPFARARAALAHGERQRRARRTTAARQHLGLALDLFDGLGLPVWRERARGELRAAGGSAPHGPDSAGERLTPQELRVARLAARGLSNREIGARLTMSPRTAGYHLAKVFPKLGVTGRAQLRDLNL
ncbi:AAA family ATPase [Streptomyces sp. BH097]|uniref:AAA family ATPase n=1 Tax=unclassified Streptomyces TaxID=2593676 RepID=UPI003BB5F600